MISRSARLNASDGGRHDHGRGRPRDGRDPNRPDGANRDPNRARGADDANDASHGGRPSRSRAAKHSRTSRNRDRSSRNCTSNIGSRPNSIERQ